MLGTRSDDSKVILGCPRKGPEVVSNEPYAGEAPVPAGIAVNRNSDGEIEEGAGDFLLGISRGVSQNHPELNSVTRKGGEVPLQLTDVGVAASGTVQIDDYAELLTDGADTITVGETVFTAQSGAATPGEGTFRAATSDEATATSLAAQINAHPVASLLVEAEAEGDTVTITALEPGEAGNEIALEYTDEGTDEAAILSGETLEGGVNAYDYAVPGTAVFVDDTTGKATAEGEGTTETNWKYASAMLEGVSPDPGGESASCALVDMVS